MKKIFIILAVSSFFALIALGLISCGARKVNKSSGKQEVKSEVLDKSIIKKESNTNVKTTTEIQTDDKNETVTEETVYEPSDNTKESFVIEKDGTKVVLNNAKKIVRNTKQKNNTVVSSNSEHAVVENNSSKEQKAVKQVNATKKENKQKQVDKKQFNPFVSICVGLFGLILLWCIYRFYKKLPLVPKL